MKASLGLFLVLIVLANVAFGLTPAFWVMGQISTSVTEVMYGTTRYYSFNLTVYDASANYNIGEEIPVILDTSLATIALVQGGWYNFTGSINDVQVDEIPLDVFIVDSIHIELEQDILIVIFRKIVEAASGVMAGIVNTIVEILLIGLGFEVPAIVVTVVLVLLALFFLVKFYAHIGLLLVAVVAFFVVSGMFNMIRLVWI